MLISDSSSDVCSSDLTAVDSAVMVIDAAKGIEPQTRKLFEVCRIRNVPIITFVNKVDREAKEPFALLDEIADVLALDVAPMSRSEEHTSELQSLMRISYAVFCMKKKTQEINTQKC